jgi:hypothetical protein
MTYGNIYLTCIALYVHACILRLVVRHSKNEKATDTSTTTRTSSTSTTASTTASSTSPKAETRSPCLCVSDSGCALPGSPPCCHGLVCRTRPVADADTQGDADTGVGGVGRHSECVPWDREHYAHKASTSTSTSSSSGGTSGSSKSKGRHLVGGYGYGYGYDREEGAAVDPTKVHIDMHICICMYMYERFI